jgi:hypothetical protein
MRTGSVQSTGIQEDENHSGAGMHHDLQVNPIMEVTMPQPQVFEDTRKLNASFFLDENGHEITKHEFVHQLKEWAGLMLYVGSGNCPLPVAVLTVDDAKRRNVDEGSAASAMEEWARNTGRADWIGEDASYQDKLMLDPDNTVPEYELVMERIPYPVEGYLFEDQYGDLKIYEGATAFYIEHIPSGDERCMGDGVDQEFYPGMIEEDYSTLMDAYFPEKQEERITCDQCQPMMIQGVFTHEPGCPNGKKTWVKGRGWVLFLTCRECGDEVEEGEACTCMQQDDEGIELVEGEE